MSWLTSLDQSLDSKVNRILPYESLYAERHNLTIEDVRNNPKLQLASFLEWQIANKTMSVSEARRKYIEKYPDSNYQDVPITKTDNKGFKYQDERYANQSVLRMIQAYDDSVREVRNLCEK